MKIEEVYLDLSKLSEEQIKNVRKVLFNAGEDMTDGFFALDYYGKTEYCYIQLANGYWSIWNLLNVMDKTELQYPEFIKLFEGGEGETSLQIALKALEDIVNPIGYMKSQLKDGESLDGHYAIMISDKPKFYQDIAKEALEKINSK